MYQYILGLAEASIYKYSFPRQQSQYWSLYVQRQRMGRYYTEFRLEYSIQCYYSDTKNDER